MTATPEKQRTKKATNIYKQKITAVCNSAATLPLYTAGIHTHSHLTTFAHTHTYSTCKHATSPALPPVSGRVKSASATETIDLDSIPGQVKPKTIKIGIHSYPA